MANEPVDLIPMPAALLACRLRSSLGCQKQVGIGHWGRSTEKENMNLRTTTVIAAFGILLWLIVHFVLFPYESLGEYPKNWVWLLVPLLRDLPLSVFLFTLYGKQK